jgi:peptide chain release factor subunit 1
MTTHEDIRKRRLRDLVEELDKIRGRHTELVSVYIPSGFNLNKVTEQIRTEQSTAQNIKSKTVRKNVLSALERILQHLKLYKQTPENGLVIFAGNISEREGVADIELWSLEPPEKLNQKLYWCDQKFVLDPLKDMIREKEIYGVIVLDKSEAEIGLLHGKKIESLKHLDSIVPGKTSKGGWSQARYARVREGLLHDFFKKVGEVATSQFKEYKDLKGIIIGGPGPIKEDFFEGKFLEYELRKKILGVVNTSYTGKYGLEEAINKAEDLIAESSVIHEKKILNRFFTELGKDSGLVVYGLKETVQALRNGSLEILLVSEGMEWAKTKFECPKCGEKIERILSKEHLESMKCRKCGENLDILEEKDITDEIIKIAEEMDTEVEMISSDTKEGNQLKEMGGIGGILRYRA